MKLLLILGILPFIGIPVNCLEWWQSMSLYQVYPRSFKDSDGDGVGDLKGIQEKLPHLVNLGVDAFWISPIYPSPMIDFGYDISDFKGVDPTFGTMEDFESLVKAAQKLSLKVIMDFVPNHSSDRHEWFQKSLKNIAPYNDFYVWHPGKKLSNGTMARPNNWLSLFGGPAWTWRDERQAYYLHQFDPAQPDLNYNNKKLVQEMKDVLVFWLDKGVSGFRVDAIIHVFENTSYLDEPLSGATNDSTAYIYLDHIYTKNQHENYEMVQQWRDVIDAYDAANGVTSVIMTEAYAKMDHIMKYYRSGSHIPFNFFLIENLGKDSNASEYKSTIDSWMNNMPAGGTANWVAGNHDRFRLVSRFGENIAQAISVMLLLLPGVSVTYNGEEIGMEDRWISYEDTQDPQGCNAGKENYESWTRDPERTPFQWDNTTSAGFSTNSTTWLPVHENYLTLNLAAQMAAEKSYYKMFVRAAELKKWPAVREGSITTRLLNDNVFAFSRELNGSSSVYTVINTGESEETVDLTVFDGIANELTIHLTTLNTTLTTGVNVNPRSLVIPARGCVVYVDVQAEESSSTIFTPAIITIFAALVLQLVYH